MQSVSPENILETKPKVDGGITGSSSSTGYHSSIRPMTEILSSTPNQRDLENTCIFQHVPECVPLASNNSTSSHHFTKVTPNSLYHSKATISTINKPEQLNIIGTKPLYRMLTPKITPTTAIQKGGKILKTIPVRNVKIQIVHASPSQRNLSSKLIDLRSVSSTSAGVIDQSISSLTPNLVNINQEQRDNITQYNKTDPERSFAVTQLKKIPQPIMTTLQQLPGTITSPLQCATNIWSPEAKNKRKRYTPFRSFLDKTYDDSDEENWTPELKKQKLTGQEDRFGGTFICIITPANDGSILYHLKLELLETWYACALPLSG